MKPVLYVPCSIAPVGEGWRARAPLHADLEVVPLFPAPRAMELVHRISAESDAPFLIARDDVWIGFGMARHVERVVEEMDRRFPNWAVCGNRGVTWDEQTLDFGSFRDEMSALTSVCGHAVVALDDNFLLINPRVLRGHKHRAPVVGSPPFGVVLALECLANGSVMAASPQLMTLRTLADSPPAPGKEKVDAEFARYYREHFAGEYFQVPGGGWDFSGLGGAPGPSEGEQASVVEQFDRALAAAPGKPSLTICCRTQFRRPEMLERAVLSFSACRSYSGLLGELQIRLVTDQPAEAAEAALLRLKTAYPAAEIDCWFHSVREPRLSRIDLLTGAIERAQTDYIWFIDDDDYVNPPALPALARCLARDCPLVVIANSEEVTEKWDGKMESAGSGQRQLKETRHGEPKLARKIFAALRGENPVPICGMIVPVKLMQERLQGRSALGEYAEDYFLLVLALTAPRVGVRVLEVELATVSLRDGENTVLDPDRSKWYQSYATFLLEALNNEDGNSAFLWQQANMSPWDWMDS